MAANNSNEEDLIQVVLNADIPIDMLPTQEQYNALDVPNRLQFLKNGSGIVRSNRPDNDILQKAQIEFCQKIRNDPRIPRELWKYDHLAEELTGAAHRFLAQQVFLARYDDETEGQTALNADRVMVVKNIPNIGRFTNFYVPPQTRIRIMKNLTFNTRDEIPVFSDLPGENLETLALSETIGFKYTYHNLLNTKVEKDLAKAVEMAKEEKNHIHCTCQSQGIANCFDNPTCPCFLMNQQLRSLQVFSPDQDVTKFATFQKTLFNSCEGVFFKNAGFACSDLCACKGQCTNNSMFFADNHVFPLEVFRNDADVGFSVRSPVFIPAGTIIKDFTGELMIDGRINDENIHYAYQVNYENYEVELMKILRKAPFTKKYKDLLMKMSKKSYHIDPLTYGNVTRMVMHSCVPNLEVVRVFRKSLSPAHISLVAVTIIDIYPGIPLSIDYGCLYSNRLRDLCKCGTFACRNNEETREMANLDVLNTAVAIKDLQVLRGDHFDKNILRRTNRNA